MKKLLTILIVAGVLIGAGGCNVIGGGHGGPTDSTNITLEVVRVNQNHQGRDSLISGGFTIILNGEGGIPSDTESTTGDWAGWYQMESRAGYLTDEGIKRDWPELGIFGKYGIEVVRDSNWFVNGIGGITFADETHLWTSALGPPHYADTSWEIYGLYGVGISHILNDSGYFQIDYDNRRGITISFGWRWK